MHLRYGSVSVVVEANVRRGVIVFWDGEVEEEHARTQMETEVAGVRIVIGCTDVSTLQN